MELLTFFTAFVPCVNHIVMLRSLYLLPIISTALVSLTIIVGEGEKKVRHCGEHFLFKIFNSNHRLILTMMELIWTRVTLFTPLLMNAMVPSFPQKTRSLLPLLSFLWNIGGKFTSAWIAITQQVVTLNHVNILLPDTFFALQDFGKRLNYGVIIIETLGKRSRFLELWLIRFSQDTL